jgi:hypothetical protein
MVIKSIGGCQMDRNILRLPARIGFWAAAAETLISLVYLIGLVLLVALALSQSSAAELAAHRWVDITTYAQHYGDDPISLTIGLVVQVSALIAGLLILIVFLVLHELAAPPLKIVTRMASAFALMMALLSSWGYYVQLAAVHQIIVNGGDLEGLSQFVETHVSSPGMATLQLAWALFYGLASLCLVPVFGNTRTEKWIKVGFLINGLIGVAVGIGYAFGATEILPLAVLGLVGTAFVYPLLALRFYRSMKEIPE